VEWARLAYGLSERRACRALEVARSTIRYRSVRPSQEALRRRLRELAAVRVRSGYRPLHVYLRREGWRVNHKRVYRLYTEEGLTLKRRRPKRRKSASVRVAPVTPEAPNERWAMDFIHDRLADGRTLRILSVLDVHTRECLALIAARTFRGAEVAGILSELGTRRALPRRIGVDNGTEFTSKALDHWAYWNRVELDFSRPGKPTDNAHVEAFHGTLRRECLSQHWFLDLEDAKHTLEQWREDYNNHRPHSALDNLPPAHFRAGGHFISDRTRLQLSHA
jgi:putative transposase